MARKTKQFKLLIQKCAYSYQRMEKARHWGGREGGICGFAPPLIFIDVLNMFRVNTDYALFLQLCDMYV